MKKSYLYLLLIVLSLQFFSITAYASDLVRIFGSGNLNSGEKTGDVVLIFSEGTIQGTVCGNCVVVGGTLHIKKGAVIERDIVTVFSALDKEEEIVIRGDQVNIGSYEISGIAGLIKSVFSSWDLLLALLLSIFCWRYVSALTDSFLSNPAATFITGFIGLIGFIPLIIFLTVSILGIFLIPLLPMVYMLGFALGFAIIGNLLGDRLANIIDKDAKQPIRGVIGLLMILILFKVIGFFPLLGGLCAEVIKMIIRTLGLGILLIKLWQSSRKTRK